MIVLELVEVVHDLSAEGRDVSVVISLPVVIFVLGWLQIRLGCRLGEYRGVLGGVALVAALLAERHALGVFELVCASHDVEIAPDLGALGLQRCRELQTESVYIVEGLDLGLVGCDELWVLANQTLVCRAHRRKVLTLVAKLEDEIALLNALRQQTHGIDAAVARVVVLAGDRGAWSVAY